ncbi:MAG: glycosyltransferase, partial [Actinomycetota bacterium]|nr:glycosyltransferase [Actinomycetota bacterium]
ASGYAGNLRSLISDLGLDDAVRLVGFRSDTISFLNSIDVFALASRSEGFGLVVLEAMVAGKAVVVREMPPLTEFVEHEQTGILVASGTPDGFADGIVRLLQDPREAEALGTRARRHASTHLSVARMTSETMGVYESVLKAKGAAAPGGGHGFR